MNTYNYSLKTWFWSACLLVGTFVAGWAYLYLPGVPLLDLLPYDSAYWLAFQASLQHPEIFAGDPYIASRAATRFLTDTVLQGLIIDIQEFFRIDLVTVNLLAHTAVLLITLYLLFLIGMQTMSSPAWAAFFGFLCFQSYYVRNMHFPVFSPKMLGMMMFAAVFFALLRMVRKPEAYWPFALILSGAFILYPASALYYSPVVVGTALVLVVLGRRSQPGSVTLGGFTLAMSLVAATVFAICQITGPKMPVPMQINDYFWMHHYVSWFSSDVPVGRSVIVGPVTLRVYGSLLWDYILLAAVTGIWLYRRGDEYVRRLVLALLAVGLGAIGLAILANVLAVSVPEIRMLWYWRVFYYAFVPLLLVPVLALKMAADRYGSEQERWRRGLPIVLCVTLAVWVITRTPLQLTTVKSSLYYLAGEMRGAEAVDGFAARMTGLLEYARGTPPESIFLVPHPMYQDAHIDLFEALALRRARGSRLDAGMMVVSDHLTEPYYKMLVEYERIEDISDPAQYKSSVTDFARSIGAHYVIVPRKIHAVSDTDAVFVDSTWAVFQVAVPAATVVGDTAK